MGWRFDGATIAQSLHLMNRGAPSTVVIEKVYFTFCRQYDANPFYGHLRVTF